MARQELKDRNNRRIGEIRDEGSRQVIYDKNNRKCGSFDGKDTYDKNNRKVGSGNLLTTLLPL